MVLPRNIFQCHSRSLLTLAKGVGGSRRFQSSLPPSHKPILDELFSLDGRCAIVTGGGTGIGASLAMGLARAGCCVILTARRQRVLEETKSQIQRQLKDDGYNSEVEQRVHAYPFDVTDFSQIKQLIQDSEFLTGIPPTILFNNAGANLRKPVDEVIAEDFAVSHNLMITAPFLLTRALSGNFKSQKYGRVVNLASLQSYAAFPNSASYASAKSGLLGLTRALAEAYSPPHGYDGVTVNAIAPGYVETDLTATVFADEERAQRLADKTILGRNSVPKDLVGAAVFLASPAAAYVTGQSLSVDGGFTSLGLR